MLYQVKIIIFCTFSEEIPPKMEKVKKNEIFEKTYFLGCPRINLKNKNPGKFFKIELFLKLIGFLLEPILKPVASKFS